MTYTRIDDRFQMKIKLMAKLFRLTINVMNNLLRQTTPTRTSNINYAKLMLTIRTSETDATSARTQTIYYRSSEAFRELKLWTS